MSIAISGSSVANYFYGSSGSLNLTNVPAGARVIVTVACGYQASGESVSDDKNGSYAQDGLYAPSGNPRVSVFSVLNSTLQNLTISYSQNGTSGIFLSATVFTGIVASNYLGVGGQNYVIWASSVTIASFTPDASKACLLIGICAPVGQSINGIPSGYTNIRDNQVVYLIQGSAGATSLTWTVPSNDSLTALVVSYKPDSGGGMSVTLSDSGSGADSLAQLLARIAASDTAAGVDALAGLLVRVKASDSGSGAESLAGLLGRIPLSDLGSAIDAVTRLIQGNSKAVSDSGTGTDSLASLLVRAALHETGAGADALAFLKVLLSRSDTGSGTDQLAVLHKIAAVDAGTAVDAVASILAKALLHDTGTAADIITAIKAHINLSDVGVGTDLLYRWIVGTAIADIVAYALSRSFTQDAGPRAFTQDAAARAFTQDAVKKER